MRQTDKERQREETCIWDRDRRKKLACVRACVCVCVRARARACIGVCVRAFAGARACVCGRQRERENQFFPIDSLACLKKLKQKLASLI